MPCPICRATIWTYNAHAHYEGIHPGFEYTDSDFVFTEDRKKMESIAKSCNVKQQYINFQRTMLCFSERPMLCFKGLKILFSFVATYFLDSFMANYGKYLLAISTLYVSSLTF